MKLRPYILIVEILLTAFCTAQIADAQVVFKNDKVNAKIQNTGTLRIMSPGSVVGMPDTINGRVEFVADVMYKSQYVPNSSYFTLLVEGWTNRKVDSVPGLPLSYPLATRDSLIIAKNVEFRTDSVEIHAKGSIKNTARFNGNRHVRANREVSSQTLEGNGRFSNLNIDNPYGVDLVNGADLTIETKLELTRGELRNDAANNINLADSIRIVRHTSGSISADPVFEGKHVKVHYVGAGVLTTGPEIPGDSTALQSLYNLTSGGVYMSEPFSVNDTLLLASAIVTGSSASFDERILTYTNLRAPIFTNSEAEIDGSFRRTSLRYDSSKVIFNNPHTYAIFRNSADANGVRELVFRVKPRTFPPFYKGEIKVKRAIAVSAYDAAYTPVESGINMRIGYGWRHSDDDLKNETNDLPVPSLVLQRWSGSNWFDIMNSLEPGVDIPSEWAFSSALVKRFGDFAIGLPGGLMLTISPIALLEGPYRYGSMAQDLRMKGLVPLTPPDIYPYNLDPNRQYINLDAIPDSIVDWVVLEFRHHFNSIERYYRTVFIRFDGKIVDLDGFSPVLLSKGGIDSGEYYVAVRHRNHLTVVTEDRISIYPKTVQQVLDFTNPANLMGRLSALKPVGVDLHGSILFGMIGGDVNGDGAVDEGDLIGTWNDRDYQDRYLNSDTRMNGIITTRDFNITWNNRGRVSNLP